MRISTIRTDQHGSARDVIDYIEYMMNLDYVVGICDTTATALWFLPQFIKHNASAQRGWALT